MNRLIQDVMLELDCIETQRHGEFLVSRVSPTVQEKILLDESSPCVKLLMTHLSAITAESFGMPLDEKSDDGTRAHLQNVNGLAILHQDKHVLGFASAFFPKEDLFYLHGVAIASSIKGRGAARALVEALRRSSGSGDMSFTTQNPSMFCLLQSMCERVYPNPNEAMPVHLQTKAKRLMERRAGTFDSSSGVAKNLYGRCLYPHIPASRDDSINEWFSSKLNIRENQTRHAFLFIGEGVR